MADIKSCDEWKPFVAMVTIDFAFAFVNILLKKVLDEGINHLVFITYRLSIAAIFLAPIGYFWESLLAGTAGQSSRFEYYFSSSSVVVGASLTQYFFLLGIQYTSATFSCAFINMVPVITFIMSLPFRMETLNIKNNSGRAKLFGALVCVGGAMTLTFYRGMPLFKEKHTHSVVQSLDQVKRTQRWTIGCIQLIVGTLLWASWFLLQSNIGKRYPCQYSSTAIMSFLGAIQSAVLSFSTGNNLSTWVLRSKIQILTVLYAGIVGSGLCYVGLSWCVKKRGPVFTAAFSPLVQIIAAMLDIPIMHEELYLGSLLGSIIVILGLYSLLWGKNKEMKNHAAKVTHVAHGTKEQESPSQINTFSYGPRCPPS